MKYWMGLDPGKQGAVAVLTDGGNAYAEALQHVDGFVDLVRIGSFLEESGLDAESMAGAVVEKVAAMPHRRMGARSAFNFGVGFGQLVGLMQATAWPYELVPAGVWQKAVLRSFKRGQSKAASIAHVMRVYPLLDLAPGQRRKPHDGMADAVCIAEWAMLHSPFRR